LMNQRVMNSEAISGWGDEVSVTAVFNKL
jgi:hypothetical protein